MHSGRSDPDPGGRNEQRYYGRQTKGLLDLRSPKIAIKIVGDVHAWLDGSCNGPLLIPEGCLAAFGLLEPPSAAHMTVTHSDATHHSNPKPHVT